MKKTKFKILLALVIICIFTIGMPIIAYGANENAVIVKQSDDEFLIYLKGLLNDDFKFAFSNDKNVTPAEAEFISFAKDTANGANNIAYVDQSSVGKFVNKTYLWVKTNEQMKISGLEIDIADNITVNELSEVGKISKTIPIRLEQEKIVDTVNSEGTKITETVGIVKLVNEAKNGKYILVAKETSSNTKDLFALAELLEKNEFTDKYTELKASKEFMKLRQKMLEDISEWNNIEENTIKQPKEAQNGEQYILWLKEGNNTDVHFLTSLREYNKEVVKEEVKTILPYTYDNNSLLIVLGVVIVAIVLVSIRIATLKKKEMNA